MGAQNFLQLILYFVCKQLLNYLTFIPSVCLLAVDVVFGGMMGILGGGGGGGGY